MKRILIFCSTPSRIFWFSLKNLSFLACLSCILFIATSADLSLKKKALIFGITGQDGSYLADFLLDKNYEVHGVERPLSIQRFNQFDQERKNLSSHVIMHFGNLLDALNVVDLIKKIQPDEIYNLAAQSHVQVSFECPEYTSNVDGLGPLRILEAIRLLGLEKKIKFYQASSSELFGKVQEVPQTENTPFYPRSPYAVAKLYAYWITKNYREAYGMFACNGILFNHESPMRGESFVTRKITLAACRYKLGLQKVLYLGNLDAKRDWGYAKDYVEAMWLMMQQPTSDDYVIATGKNHSVREFVELAFKELDVEIEWRGQNESECGMDRNSGQVIVAIDPKYYRPAEVDLLLGNAEKAQKILKWNSKTSFQDLLKIMVASDLQKVLKEKYSNLKLEDK
ncbi:MAG: GDP-mannose 4,6-dehydratase [Parachlamydiaceae bacterium]|nr:GDP-mannose 4,6-dehydratase [Parachlamydiaceae bacterium]